MDAHAHLDFLASRRSVRRFEDRPVPREVLERLLMAASSAPSPSNRQPWRFAVVTSRAKREAIAAAVRGRADALRETIAKGHHAEDFGRYGDFFWEPLASAATIIVPQFRAFPDQLAAFIESAGADPTRFETAAPMEPERCAASAAVMLLLVQAHAEGLGACWMAGPMVARSAIRELLSVRPPWDTLGAIALGWPLALGDAKPARKPLDRVGVWFDDEHEEESE